MRLTILLTALLALGFALAERIGYTWVTPEWKLLLGFYVCAGWLTHRLLQSATDHGKFISLYLTAVVIRLILSLGFVGLFLFWHVADRRTFVFTFLALYIFYTGFEIWGLQRNLRRDS